MISLFKNTTADRVGVRVRVGDKPESRLASRADIACSIGLMILFVLILSLFFFSGQSLRLDESQSLWQTSHSIPEIMLLVAEDIHVPLYHLLLHFWQLTFGSGVATARMLSLVFYLGLIPTIYFLGKQVYGQTVGLFAAFLMTISPFMNWYGDEIRMYTIFALLTLVNQYFFICLFTKRDEWGMVPRKYWIGYAISFYLGMFSHYFFAFNLVTQAIFFFMYREHFPYRALRKFAGILAIGVVLFAPWAWYVVSLGTASNTQPQLVQPTSIDLFNTFSQFMFGFQDDRINTILVSLWPLLVLMIFLSLRRNKRVSPQTVYLFFSLFTPILLAFAVSLFVKPIYLTRYLILSLPPLYLLISWVLTIYSERVSRIIRFGLITVMLLTLGIEMASAATPVKEDYKDAALYLNSHVAPQDIVVASAPFTIYPIEYYYRGTADLETLPIWDQTAHGAIPPFSEATLPAEVNQLKGDHQTLWLLLSYDQGYEANIKNYFDTHFKRTYSANYSQDLNLYAYKLRYDQGNVEKAVQQLNSGASNTSPTIKKTVSTSATTSSPESSNLITPTSSSSAASTTNNNNNEDDQSEGQPAENTNPFVAPLTSALQAVKLQAIK